MVGPSKYIHFMIVTIQHNTLEVENFVSHLVVVTKVFFIHNFILVDLLWKAANTPMAFLCQSMQSTYIFSAKVLCVKVFYKKVLKHLIFYAALATLNLEKIDSI